MSDTPRTDDIDDRLSLTEEKMKAFRTLCRELERQLNERADFVSAIHEAGEGKGRYDEGSIIVRPHETLKTSARKLNAKLQPAKKPSHPRPRTQGSQVI